MNSCLEKYIHLWVYQAKYECEGVNEAKVEIAHDSQRESESEVAAVLSPIMIKQCIRWSGHTVQGEKVGEWTYELH